MLTATTTHAGARILQCLESISGRNDSVRVIEACFEQGTRRLLLERATLPAAFFDLKTRFAGEFLQKMQNYQVRVALVLPLQGNYGERFEEFLVEARQGRMFRVFEAREAALDWLATGTAGDIPRVE